MNWNNTRKNTIISLQFHQSWNQSRLLVHISKSTKSWTLCSESAVPFDTNTYLLCLLCTLKSATTWKILLLCAISIDFLDVSIRERPFGHLVFSLLAYMLAMRRRDDQTAFRGSRHLKNLSIWHREVEFFMLSHFLKYIEDIISMCWCQKALHFHCTVFKTLLTYLYVLIDDFDFMTDETAAKL